MNFTDVLKALNQASAFELYRMRAAIDRVLDEPRWMAAIQSACISASLLNISTLRPIVRVAGNSWSYAASRQ